ncbi:MAG: hypothetical protein V4440_10325 [Pseudomonadota bacterium]
MIIYAVRNKGFCAYFETLELAQEFCRSFATASNGIEIIPVKVITKIIPEQPMKPSHESALP